MLCSNFHKNLFANLRNFSLKKVENLLYATKWPYVVKSIASRIFLSVTKYAQWTFSFRYNQSELKKVEFLPYLQKITFFSYFKSCSFTCGEVFFCLKCHLTPILLITAKQCWCHFEANECIFNFSPKYFFLPSADSQSTK